MDIIKLYRDHSIRTAGMGERHYKEGWMHTTCHKINKEISKKLPGCHKLDQTKSYKFEIQYNEYS